MPSSSFSPEDKSRPSRPAHIVILGGGFSGTLLAVNLLRTATVPLRITIVDRGTDAGRGVAYSSASGGLLLNVPARRMSALADAPNHFVDWLQKNHRDFGADDFVPRAIYGSYVSELFATACSSHASGHVAWVQDEVEAVHILNGLPEIELHTSSTIQADVVVLAIGNPPPHIPHALRELDPQLASHAWDEHALEGVPSDGRVLILGTGLTAVDQVAALEAQGFQGALLMLSRRGRLPAPHGNYAANWPQAWTEVLPHALSDLVTAIRQQIKLARAQQQDWRAVMDSLRSVTPAVWSGLSSEERSRFLRHLQAFWDVARHRMPPQLHTLIEKLRGEERLTVEAGTLLTVDPCEGKVRVQYRRRGQTNVVTAHVDKVINCTGSSSNNHGLLMSSLLHAGLATPDAVGLGIQTENDGTVLSQNNNADPRIFAIGPVRKASAWESTAVAEIRVQAAELAAKLLDILRAKSAENTQRT